MPFTRNESCEIYYEVMGESADPTLLLINGLGSQCIFFAEAWCEQFVKAGFRVVRFDNRDVGLSSKLDDAPVASNGAAYGLSDMGGDAVAVLDAVGADKAHVMGLSMGGMIAQQLAIEGPERMHSLVSAISTTGEPDVGRPSPEAWKHLTRPPATDRASFVEGHVGGMRVWGSPAYADEARWRADAERAFERCFHPSGPRRHFFAVGSSPPRAEGLRQLELPALVIHGDCDTLVDPSGGRRTAELIPGARFELIEGMGHDYPPGLRERWVELVADFALG